MKYLFLLFVLLTKTALAQSPTERIQKLIPELNKKVENFKENGHLSSVAYAITYNGEIIHQYYTGVLNQQTQKRPNAESVYRIASMSKSFAGMAILQLRDAGKLKLDDAVINYIPEINNSKYSADSPDITIRQLLTHSAGLPEDNPWGDRQLGISNEEMLTLFRKGLSYSNEPGVAYEYSNTAFAMLGYIIQKVSGQTFQNYITEHIFVPLGMKNTYWDYTKVPQEHLALGYRWIREQFIPQPIEKDGAYGIMGGILTSTEDFAKYMALHQNAYLINKPASPILRKSSIKEMHYAWNFNSLNRRGFDGNGTPCVNVSHYGYGLRLDQNCENIKMVGHSGGLPGYGSDWKILPQYGLGIVTMANGTYGSAALLNNEILPYIVSHAQLKPVEFPVSPILEQRKTELLQILPSWKNAESNPIFAVNFFGDYFTDLLINDTEKIFNKIGKIIKVHDIIAENALRGSFIIEGENGNAEVSFTLSPENPALIQSFKIVEKR